eukprot:7083068-Ditylum_brightwellii.AAC.1
MSDVEGSDGEEIYGRTNNDNEKDGGFSGKGQNSLYSVSLGSSGLTDLVQGKENDNDGDATNGENSHSGQRRSSTGSPKG